MYDYGFFSYDSKADMLERSRAFWNPDKTDFWQDAGIDLVIDRREGYLFWDMAGRRLIDLHLNGGTYNLGHRNPELIATLEQAMQHFDIGNHHFPALARTALAEALVKTCSPNMRRVIYGAAGGEAIDIAIKTARHTKHRRKIVSLIKAYHGHTGLAVGTGDDRFSKLFLADHPEEFINVPFNDLNAMEDALKGRDVAGVLIESIPATYGFPLPEPGYLQAVKRLCEEYDTLYIADEVQTGLMRTGEMWCISKSGVEPDIMVIGKGISGGMYPLSCVVVSEECSAWLKEDGFGHITTVGGSELAAIMGHNPYSDFFDVVASKLATLEGGSSWTGGGEACWWGTLFEDVVCAYVEADLGGPIRGDDICIQEVEGHRNSPDGYIVAQLYRGTGGALHLWTTDMSPEIPTTPRILLLEFK